jgi:hypothetical protein
MMADRSKSGEPVSEQSHVPCSASNGSYRGQRRRIGGAANRPFVTHSRLSAGAQYACCKLSNQLWRAANVGYTSGTRLVLLFIEGKFRTNRDSDD